MPGCGDTDLHHLERAIELAARGAGAVRPNPVVGAVIARDGHVLGEGWHREYGGAHAEVNAIEDCGMAELEGATLYVSLEPCCHEGKTPPCTDAILQAGIRRVVVASDDPTEKASGRGLGILRDEGVEVVLADGELASAARLLNQAFRKHARVGRPWVLFKSAMTLDGKVATRTGDSKWISGEESRELAHRWRASVDAVVVGIGTALADDPQLTARPSGTPAEPEEQPRRVVFDSLARLPPSSQLVAAADRIPLSVVVSRAAARADMAALEVAGVQVIVATGENEPARVRSALDQLGAMGVSSMLLEGGPHLAGAFLDADEIDEIRLFLAPMLLGGSAARDPMEGEGVERIAEATRALSMSCETIGEDLLISSRLREW
jgi:diaminohydroxyphosphoribosylaminopyrimidine deaminase / 5-amino-6-(5-phosphoribosylamino)uracil reductase